jgi:hypothetical protein
MRIRVLFPVLFIPPPLTGSSGNWPFLYSFRRSTSDTKLWTIVLPRYGVLGPPCLKSKVGSTLIKVTVLRINLNIDGESIVSKPHDHPYNDLEDHQSDRLWCKIVRTFFSCFRSWVSGTFYFQIKSKVGNIPTKTTSRRVNLNIHGTALTDLMYTRILDSPVLSFSLS